MTKKKRKRQDLCNCCDDKFTTLTSLKARNEVVHEGATCSCDHCDLESMIKYLKKEPNLKAHNEAGHVGEHRKV